MQRSRGEMVSHRVGVAGLPIGFRFQPTDEELVLHYLRRKALGCPLPADIIPVIDLTKYDPWDLPGEGEGEKYFFYLPHSKHSRYKRATRSGYWKATGNDKLVVATPCKRTVATKKTLVFHQGKPPHGSRRTHWIMHEYRLAAIAIGSTNSCMTQAKDWMVCRIFRKNHARRLNEDLSYRRAAPMGCRVLPMPLSPSSSCITDLSDNDEEGSNCSITSSP